DALAHVVLVEHATIVAVFGFDDHEEPPLVVKTVPLSPVAKQTPTDGHETLSNSPVPSGSTNGVHVTPRSGVENATPENFDPLEWNAEPTGMDASADAQLTSESEARVAGDACQVQVLPASVVCKEPPAPPSTTQSNRVGHEAAMRSNALLFAG